MANFITTRQRLVVIIQLCLAFSLMLWVVFQPFMGEYFALRSRMLLYEYVMGTSTIFKSEDERERQINRFKLSPERELIIEDYRQLENYAKRSPLEKIKQGLQTLIQKVPPFEQAWIFFSIVISILILLRKEGATKVAWLLPLIVLAYALDNQTSGKMEGTQPDHHLFPPENLIVQKYIEEPFSKNPNEQRKQLEKGWNQYLIKNWSSNENLEEGEFNFTVARLKLLHGQPYSEWLYSFHKKLTLTALMAYFIWNFLFAWIIYPYRSSLNLKAPMPAK